MNYFYTKQEIQQRCKDFNNNCQSIVTYNNVYFVESSSSKSVFKLVAYPCCNVCLIRQLLDNNDMGIYHKTFKEIAKYPKIVVRRSINYTCHLNDKFTIDIAKKLLCVDYQQLTN